MESLIQHTVLDKDMIHDDVGLTSVISVKFLRTFVPCNVHPDFLWNMKLVSVVFSIVYNHFRTANYKSKVIIEYVYII